MKAWVILCCAFAAFPLFGQTVDGFNTIVNNRVRAIGAQSDGKVIIGGQFTTVAGATRNRLARLFPDGTLDSTFNITVNDTVVTLVVQTDDKIIIGGGFTQVGTYARNRIARLNSDGSVDTAFNPGANEWVHALALQNDGMILVGGAFTSLASQTRNYIGRLQTSGAADLNFNPGASNQVNTFAVQPDGKIVVGGFFTGLGGQTRNYIGRLNGTGTLDTTFNPNAGSTVWRVALQSDGRILVGGSFASMGGQVRSNIARLQTTGALDTAFNPLASNIVNSIIVRTNGRIIAAGNFTGIGGQARNYIASLNPDGTLDTSFTPGANATIYTLFQQPDGRILAGGDFTLFGGLTNNRVARVHFGPPNDDFFNSAALTGNEHFVLLNSTGATREFREPNHAEEPGAGSLWWYWTAPQTGPVALDTTGSGYATLLAVYTGSVLSNLTLVASNFYFQEQDPGRSRLGFNAVSGQTYRIAVDAAFADEQGVCVLYLLANAALGNDAFARAYLIPPGTLSVNGSNINATKEPGEPDHVGVAAERSIWWRWQAQTSGPVTIDTAGSAVGPLLLAVYTGSSLASLAPVAGDNGSPESSVTFSAVAGTTYYIAVDAEHTMGLVTLNFRQRPPNDNFANRIPLTGSSVTAFGENRGATEEVEPNHANAYGTKSVWWQWTAPSSGLYTLDAIGSSFNPAIAVYTGSTLPGLAPVANDDGSSKSASRLSFSAIQNTIYQIAVDGDFNNKGGDIVLHLTPAETVPSNDYFANRINITQWPAVIRGANIGATREDVNEVPFDSNGTLWWQFIAPGNGMVTLQKLAGVPSLRLVALEGASVSALTILADNLNVDALPTRFDCLISFPVRAGNAYLISVGNSDPFFQWTTGLDQGDFSLSVSFTPAPPNDNFANRIVIPPGTLSVTGTTVAATVEFGEPPGGTNSIWWSYTPAVSGPIILTTVGSAIDTFLGVYTGSSVGALSRVATNDVAYSWPALTGPTNDRPSRVKFNGVAGQPYRIVVSTARGAAGEVLLNFPTLAIEDILSIASVLQPNRTMDFTANVRLTNLRTSPSGPLRVRIFARAGYSHLDGLFENCGSDLPPMDVADQELTTIDLGPPGFLSAQSSIDTVVSGSCAPPYETGEWGQGWGAMAVLEELTENGWEVRDSRLLIFGNWPRVGGFIGPGGGVITVASGMGQVFATPGFIDVSIGPPAAVRLGARWRVTPGNCGSVCSFTNFTDQALSLVTRAVDFTIDVTSMDGFKPPTNQTIRLRAGLHTPLPLIYEVNPPRLFYNRSTGLSITGTPGTAYRIEAASRLQPPNWTSNAGRTLSAGQNAIPNTAPSSNTNRYYRAFWLSN